MRNVMNTYNASFIPPLPPPPAPALAPTYQQKNYSVPSSGYSQLGFTQNSTRNVMSASMSGNKRVNSENVSTPSTSRSEPGKRKVPEVSVEAPPLVTRKPGITTAQENSIVNDLVSTSPSVSEPEIDDLFNIDFPDVEYVDETFPISEIFNFDVDSPMKTGSWAPPDSLNANPERTVPETTQGKDMSTQGVCFDTSFAGVDGKTDANSVTKCI